MLLKAVGDAPIMKTKKWAVDRGRTVQSLSQFISRFLKLDANEQLVRMILPYFVQNTNNNKKQFEHINFAVSSPSLFALFYSSSMFINHLHHHQIKKWGSSLT